MYAGIEKGRSRRAWIATLASVALAASFCALPRAASAAEAQTHLFDATLSLTGDCGETSAADPVPDPGCPDPPHPPAGRFAVPHDMAVDAKGDIYVLSLPEPRSREGVIDVFDASGRFLTEIAEDKGPHAIAVDSKGNLYLLRQRAVEMQGVNEVVRFTPKVYEPTAGKIEYEPSPTLVVAEALFGNEGIAIDASADPSHRDHLYVVYETHVNEYNAAVDGNTLLTDEIGKGILQVARFAAIDPTSHDIYVSDAESITAHSVIRVFDGGSSEHLLERTISGDAATGPSCPSSHRFNATGGYLSPAIDGSNGHLFVYDVGDVGPKAVYEFDGTGTECISRIEKSFVYQLGSQIGIDNGVESPNGVLNPRGRYLFVPSGGSASDSHLYAFEPRQISTPPVVESLFASEITRTDAELSAVINPRSA